MPTYRAPGVFVTEVPNPSIGALPSGFRLPGLVATGKTNLAVKNTAVVKGATNSTDAIPLGGYSAVVSITSAGDSPDLAQYKAGTDYNQVNNGIQWISGGQQPTTAATYYVSWARAKTAAEYLPVMHTNMRDVRDAYGNEVDAGVIQSIPIAAKFLFDNGAPAIIITQATTASQSDLQTAIDAMKSQDIDVLVVPQATNTTMTNYIRSHVLNQSSPTVRHERVYITSADGFSDATTTLTNKATVSMAHERLWMLAPPSFVATLVDATYKTDVDVLLPSTYLAAQYAGSVTNPNFDAAAPLTRRTLVGAKNLSSFNYLESEKDYLGSNGVTVIESATGGIRVRHALTTDLTNVNTVTQSVVLIKDNIKKTLRPFLDRTYIGTKITSRTPSDVSSTIKTFLEQKITDQIIVEYRNIAVTQDTLDPRTINVRFDIKPSYPLEFVDVAFSLFTA